MKEFEKWWVVNQRTIRHDELVRKEAAKASWKTALKWVLREALPSSVLEDYSGDISRNIINKELND